MLLQKNSQRRSQSSTRIELARDLHDSLAQDLVSIAFKLDLLLSRIPIRFRKDLRAIRSDIGGATNRVRKELFALRSDTSGFKERLNIAAKPLELHLNGETNNLSLAQRRILDELVRNAADHSKGRTIYVEIGDSLISVSDDGQGMFGVAELVEEIGGTLEVSISSKGTKVEIGLP